MVKGIGVCRLTKDVETRYTADGKAVATLSVAINNGKDDTTFLNLVAFGKLAEICTQYLGKGSLIEVIFVIKNSNYKDKDGKTVYRESYILENVEFLSASRKDAQKEEDALFESAEFQVSNSDDDLPF